MCKPDKTESPLPDSVVDSAVDNNANNTNDERPLVKDLLEEHALSIDSVRRKISSDPLYYHNNNNHNNNNDDCYDDLWILRYVLSHKGNTKSATKAALKTMKFRDEWKLNEKNDYRYRIKNCGGGSDDSGIPSLPGYEQFNAHCGKGAMIFVHPDPDRGLLVCADMGAVDADAIVENISDADYREAFLSSIEAQYQILDAVTRRTGRLTKLTRFVDIGGMSFNRKYLKRDASVQKELEDYFPQLLHKQYLFNVPTWLKAIWAVITATFPKRFIEKLDVCPSDASSKFYQPIAKHVAREHLPTRFGGTNTNWPPPSIAECSFREEEQHNNSSSSSSSSIST